MRPKPRRRNPRRALRTTTESRTTTSRQSKPQRDRAARSVSCARASTASFEGQEEEAPTSSENLFFTLGRSMVIRRCCGWVTSWYRAFVNEEGKPNARNIVRIKTRASLPTRRPHRRVRGQPSARAAGGIRRVQGRACTDRCKRTRQDRAVRWLACGYERPYTRAEGRWGSTVRQPRQASRRAPTGPCRRAHAAQTRRARSAAAWRRTGSGVVHKMGAEFIPLGVFIIVVTISDASCVHYTADPAGHGTLNLPML